MSDPNSAVVPIIVNGAVAAEGIFISADEILVPSHILAFTSSQGTFTATDLKIGIGSGLTNGQLTGGTQIDIQGAALTSAIHTNPLQASSTSLEGVMFTPGNAASIDQDYAIIHINSGSSSHAAGLAIDSTVTSSTPVTVHDIGYTTGYPAFGQLPNESQSGLATTVTEGSYTGAYATYSTPTAQTTVGYGHMLVDGITTATVSGANVVIGTDSTGGILTPPALNYPLIQIAMSALTPTAEAQIEYWMTQDGEAPAIQRLYHGLLGRAGSAAEVQYYSSLYLGAEQQAASANGVTYATSAQTFAHDNTIIQYFLNSTEFTSAHSNISNSDFVNLLYSDELGRSPSSAESSFYVNQLNAGTTKATIVGYFISSPEAIAHAGAWTP
jgi:hypothetical protein